METSWGVFTQVFERMKNIMNKFSKALIAIFAVGALSQSCGLIENYCVTNNIIGIRDREVSS